MSTIAIVGLSNNPERPSFQVGLYLKNHGFNIIPVNPTVSEVFGIKSYPSLLDIPTSVTVDIVDVFRRPDQVIPILEDVVKSGRHPQIWLQDGVGSPEAKDFCQKNGLEVVMDMCMMREKATPENVANFF